MLTKKEIKMEITYREITVREITNGFRDCDDKGVFGLDGFLNIRPAYQREFVYKPKQQEAVINTVSKNLPLNIMYWEDNGDGNYSVIDGQQRTLSLCRYIDNKFSINHRFFHNLTEEEQNVILDYKIMIYMCKGSALEKLEWFDTINTAGEKLNQQELRNSIYTGTWLTAAKRSFSKANCKAADIGAAYFKGSPIRQDLLEIALSWIADRDSLAMGEKYKIEDYMAAHQHDGDDAELWKYYTRVINWVNSLFTNTRTEMKQVNWGWLYNRYIQQSYNLNREELENKIKQLMMDDSVTKKAGIYPYLFTNDEKFLNIRAFSDAMKRRAFEKQGGVCTHCGKECSSLKEMEADHVKPWSEGGKTSEDNLQMLCKECNRRKSNK